MKLTTTLKLLRDNDMCVEGYNKVVRSLQGLPYNKYTDWKIYIEFNHTDEINLLSILDSNGIRDCLWSLRATVQNSDRTARLIGVKCAREVQHLMTDPRSIAALDVAERYADGAATEEELTEAGAAARVAGDAAWDATMAAARVADRASWAAGDSARVAARAAEDAAGDAWAATMAAARAADRASWAAGDSARVAARAAEDASKRREEIIRSFLQEE